MLIAVLFMIAKIEKMKNGGIIIQCISIQQQKHQQLTAILNKMFISKKNHAE